MNAEFTEPSFMPKEGPPSPQEPVTFGPFELLPTERLLRRDGVPLPIGGRAMDILLELIEHEGEIVSQRRLFERVWPGISIEASSLRFQVSALRKALGDGANGVEYIANIPGRGYSFVGRTSRRDDARSARTAKYPLPPALDPMVGRDEVVGLISGWLEAERFVTIVGPGGIGKTTVALAVAHANLTAFEGAVCFVDLGLLSSADQAPGAVAAALNLPISSADAMSPLLASLAQSRTLLVLDSCEHVIDGVAALAEAIYSAAPRTHILATSREPMRVTGETVHRLAALACPPEDAGLTMAQLLTFPAAQLFVERVRAGGGEQAFEDSDAPVIAEICDKLDGMALAIELAAGRVAAYGLHETAASLEHRLRLSWRGQRTALARHQSLNATLDWSYDVLSDFEQYLLRGLSVFVSPFRLEAAEAVLGRSDVEASDIGAGIASLVAKSLMSTQTRGGAVLYRLLDTTRAYLAGKLAQSGETNPVARRHAAYLLGQTAGLANPAVSSSPHPATPTFADLLPEIRSALKWCFGEQGDSELGGQLVAVAAPMVLDASLLTATGLKVEVWRKEPVSWPDGGERGPEILWEDAERVFCRIQRPDDQGNPSTVLAVLPAQEPPTAASLERFTHELRLKDQLEAAGAVRPLALEHARGRTMLVLEDTGGQPLERLLGAPMDLGRFLRLAVSMVGALGNAHRHGLVHKDLKPANILVNPSNGEVRLTGFGVASRLPREWQAPEPLELITATPAYMAPEQTGRMNHSMDARSDLYSLGVTFYQMLTGVLPFVAADPMEWAQAHIAREPIAPSVRLETIPRPVSALVMKLLAKAPEQRYQTAEGAERDLRRCLAEWEAQGRIEEFRLGQRDRPDQLLIPEKLYGRAREVGTLLGAFDRVVAGGAPELVLVSGCPGIGKSAVVNELHRALVPARGLFAAGKFDRYRRDIPYATLAQALQGLISPHLAKKEVELALWRDDLREATGPNAQLMLIPDLEPLIGGLAPAPELPAQEAQRRFELVFRRLIGIRPEHPLVLFLDDMQWIDAATLDLLEHLATDSEQRHLLLIGAYRDNEVEAGDPLMRRLAAIQEASGRVRQIVLGPLKLADVGQLIADSLQSTPERVAALAGQVRTKTGGNPFFTIQFLSALVDQGLVTFDHKQRAWTWDLEGIEAEGFTDNVVELMIGKLHRLPDVTQQALRQLACLGDGARTATLAMVQRSSETALEGALWEAMRAGLVLLQEGVYRFAHDRVQEAAYALIPPDERASAHLAIGRLLEAHASPERREEAIFEIVNQLNRGASLITSRDEREHLATLNLLAGKRARASSAHAAALTYFERGAAQLPEDSWDRHQALTFELELQRAGCEVWTGALDEAEHRLAALVPRAGDMVQRAAVASMRVDLYTSRGSSDRAVAVALECLRHVGIAWGPHPSAEEAQREYARIWSQIGSRAIEDLVDLPLVEDPEVLATLDVLTTLGAPSLYTDQNLYALTVCRAVSLSLERGNSDAAPAHYVSVGLIAADRFGDYEAGYRFGQLACDLVERRGLRRFEGKARVVFQLLAPWTRPVRDVIRLARRAFETSYAQGDLTFAGYACHGLVSNLLAAGEPLAEVEREAEHGRDFVRRVGFEYAAYLIAPQLALARTLRGGTSKLGSLDGGEFSERSFEDRVADKAQFAMPEGLYWIAKQQARFFAGDYAAAIAAEMKAEGLLARATSLLIFIRERADFHFYAALSHTASAGPASALGDEHLRSARAHLRRLQAWAAHCPANFDDRVALVSAEVARIEGRLLDAEQLYEQAVRAARAHRLVHHEALAQELAAGFYLSREFETIGRAYLREARRCYVNWGADAKVRQIDALHSGLLTDEPASA